jgi:hypothetical protein
VLLLLFEQLNQHHKRAAYLGQGPNFAKRTHRPLSKDPNFSKKRFLKIFENCLPKPQKWWQKGFLEE